MATEPTLLSRSVSRSFSFLLRLLTRARFMGKVDLAQVLTDHTEQLLNLPGRLPVFPSKPTDPGKVATPVLVRGRFR